MTNNEPKIEIGRRVRYSGYYCNTVDGVIVAIRGELKGRKPSPGPMQVIRADDATFDVVTFDGIMHDGKREHDVGRLGIGGLQLLDRVHGPAMIERANRLVAERQAREVIERAQAEQAAVERQGAAKIEHAPLFYWNGMKDAKGAKLQRCWYSESGARGTPEGTITIYAREYDRFSAQVRACFEVENDTEIMTDYFDKDRIRVFPNHPLYPQVKAAMQACADRQAKRA